MNIIFALAGSPHIKKRAGQKSLWVNATGVIHLFFPNFSVNNFPVGLPPLKKTSIKKKCQKGTPPFLAVFGFLGKPTGKLQFSVTIVFALHRSKLSRLFQSMSRCGQDTIHFIINHIPRSNPSHKQFVLMKQAIA